MDDRHFGYKKQFQKNHWLLFLLLGTVLYWCIADGQRADRKETARSVGGRRGRERERERASVRIRRRRGPRKREEMAMAALPLDSRRARECFAEEELSSKEERRWRDREKSRW
jgi:hypothetical protein